jgi:hypothetical protein
VVPVATAKKMAIAITLQRFMIPPPRGLTEL